MNCECGIFGQFDFFVPKHNIEKLLCFWYNKIK